MDLYIILGLERGATLNDIKRAYKRLARKHHPDINPGDRLAEQKFRQIAEAYETLSDPDRRRQYVATEPSEEETVARPRLVLLAPAITIAQRMLRLGNHIGKAHDWTPVTAHRRMP